MKKLLLFSLMLMSSTAFANNVYTTQSYDISNLVFFSKSESFYPAWAGAVQVIFTSDVVWSETDVCNTKSVGIRAEDTHMISFIMAAKTQSKPVRLYTDSRLKVSGNYCYLRAVSY